MDSISNEVKLDVDNDCFLSSPDGKTDPSENVVIPNEVLSLDEKKDIPRKIVCDDEALAIDDYIEAELEKIGNMTLEEIDAAADKAYVEFFMADQEAQEAIRKSNKAFEHLHAITKTSEKDSFMDLKWVGRNQTPREATEAVEAAIEECYAALRERRAADHKVERSTRLLAAIFRARGKRPMTKRPMTDADCESGGASCSY